MDLRKKKKKGLETMLFVSITYHFYTAIKSNLLTHAIRVTPYMQQSVNVIIRNTYKGYFDNMGREKRDLRPPLSLSVEKLHHIRNLILFNSVY